jgi:polyribonucleotide nucleotidyltransferase
MSHSPTSPGCVVGKGGETIREINQTTGAVLEITKDRSDCVGELKPVHIVSGTREQLIHAKQMIDQIITQQEQLNAEYQSGEEEIR